MCGIAAIFNLDTDYQIDKSDIEAMTYPLSHRGPDGADYYLEEQVALGHARLAIIDIDGGTQPFIESTKRAVISYNGEIYNFEEVRISLLDLGFEFKSKSDTEVILNAWLAWGADCLAKFNGMFAFVIWDKAEQVLFAARDRLGIKPLHYTITQNNQLLIGSEIKSFYSRQDINFELDSRAVEDFLSLGYIIEPKSIYRSIEKLEAGHYFLAKPTDSKINPISYWDVNDHFSQSNDVDSAKLKSLIHEAVKKRMIADVPVGAFLSGGLDSSLIVSLMAQQSAESIHTCSIGFDLSKYDESSYAERVAKLNNTDHSTTNVSVNDLSLVDLLIDVYDEPFADNSAIPTLILSKATREKVKVSLSGDGSDELFFGYRNYQMLKFEEKLRAFIPKFIRKPIFSFLAKYYPKLNNAPRFLRGKSTFKALSEGFVESHHNSMSLSNRETVTGLFSFDFQASLGHYSSLGQFKNLAETAKATEPLKVAQYIDFKTYLTGDILTKVDRASMAGSLEARVPFLDHNVVEYGVSLSSSVNLKGSKVKVALSDTFQDLLPSFVREREKMGFTSPLDEWIRQIPMATLEKRIVTEDLVKQNIFSITKLKLLLQEHYQRKSDNGVLIWAILILEAFLRKNKNRL